MCETLAPAAENNCEVPRVTILEAGPEATEERACRANNFRRRTRSGRASGSETGVGENT